MPFSTTPIYDPDGILFDALGSFAGTPNSVLTAYTSVTDGQGSIGVLNAAGVLTPRVGPLQILNNNDAMAFDSLNRLHISVAANRTVVRFNGLTPQVLLTLPGSVSASVIVIDLADNIWISCGDGAIRRYSSAGALEATINIGGSYPGLGYSRGGVFPAGIYISNRSTGELSRVGAGDTLVPVGAGFPGGIYSIHFNAAGEMFAADTDSAAGTVWRISCAAVTGPQPDPSTCPGGTVSMSVSATGPGTFTYQWRHPLTDGGVPVPVENGIRISGADTNTLTITSALPADAGAYDCLVTNGCGTLVSTTVTLFVSCSNLADVARLGGVPGCDGRLTADDVVVFLTAFFASQPLADVASLGGSIGPDGQFTPDDIIAFLTAFFAGCP